MTSRVDWHGDEWVNGSLHPAVEAGLERAAIAAQLGMRRGMGSEGGGVLRKATKRRKGGGFVKNAPGKGRKVFYASPPGRYPGVRSSFLRSSIVWWRPRSGATGAQAPFVRIGVPGGLSAKSGVSVSYYARLLETSTNPRMRRPWAMRTINDKKADLSKSFAAGARRWMEANR